MGKRLYLYFPHGKIIVHNGHTLVYLEQTIRLLIIIRLSIKTIWNDDLFYFSEAWWNTTNDSK
jgi:hypothetical protein